MPSLLSEPPVPLKPGDILLYWSKSFYSTVIFLKTWHKVAHVETYIGNGLSAASRNGIGVNTYPLRLDGLIRVLRPNWPFDIENALRWHRAHIGEPYDWKSLAAFVGIREKPDAGMFCSEHSAWMALAGGGRPFANEPCGSIAPFQFDVTPAYSPAWSK